MVKKTLCTAEDHLAVSQYGQFYADGDLVSVGNTPVAVVNNAPTKVSNLTQNQSLLPPDFSCM